ncbi:PREDICTED: sugar phosphate exchanger 2-like, partial [Priapulus caudatus]|uniref:Sugar phosphate exchanger 3 n=1 Tax=Priapulus caudatus TaxID=37621 RepID=A0ABM1E4V3_PRICU
MTAPLGIQVVDKICCKCHSKNVWYRSYILVFTFLCYTAYHLSRKPISIVQNVLHGNCSALPGFNSSDPNACDWAPFDHSNYMELEGALNYGYLFSYAIGMFFVGHIAERVTLRYVLSFGMILSGITTVLFGLGRIWNIHLLTYYMAVQIAGGIVQSTGWPCVVTCVGNWFGNGHRGLLFGVWNSHTSVGNILGSLIAGVWVETNWALSFIVPGLIIIGLGILVFFFLVTDPTHVGCSAPDYHGDLVGGRRTMKPVFASSHTKRDVITTPEVVDDENYSEEESLLVPNHNMDSLNAIPDSSLDDLAPISFMRALRIQGVIEYSLCLFQVKLVGYTLLYWLPMYIQNTAGYSASESADLSTFFDIGGIVGGILAGIVSDYTGKSASTCTAMLVLSAPMMFIYEAYGNISLKNNIALLMLMGLLVNGPYALITTAVSADL